VAPTRLWRGASPVLLSRRSYPYSERSGAPPNRPAPFGGATPTGPESLQSALLTLYLGLGVGGVFVAAALILLLAYLDVSDAGGDENAQVRRTLLATIVPLALTFGGIVLYQSLQVL